MNGKKGLGGIMSALLAAMSFVGQASAYAKKKVKKPDSAGVVFNNENGGRRGERKKRLDFSSTKSGVVGWVKEHPKISAGIGLAGLSAIGYGVYRVYDSNLHKRFAKELGSFYGYFFGCKSVEELCVAIDKCVESGLRFYEVNFGPSQSFFSLDTSKGREISGFRDLFLDGVSVSGILGVGSVFVDVRKGENILDVASRWLFYSSLIICCKSCNLVSCKSNGRMGGISCEVGSGGFTLGVQELAEIRDEFKKSGDEWKKFADNKFKGTELLGYIDQIGEAVAAKELKWLVVSHEEYKVSSKFEVYVGEKYLLEFLKGEKPKDGRKKEVNDKKIEEKFRLCKKFVNELVSRFK